MPFLFVLAIANPAVWAAERPAGGPEKDMYDLFVRFGGSYDGQLAHPDFPEQFLFFSDFSNLSGSDECSP